MIKCIKCKIDKDELCFISSKNNKTITYSCDVCRGNKNKKRELKEKSLSPEEFELFIQKRKKKSKESRLNNIETITNNNKSPERKKYDSEFKKKWIRKNPQAYMWKSAKKRAKESNLAFDISIQDIFDIWPKDNKCPIFQMELAINSDRPKDNSFTLDRIIPDLGYIKNNIVVVSFKANRIKNDATIGEIKKILHFLKGMS